MRVRLAWNQTPPCRLHLHEIEQTPEAPGHGVEPLGAGVGPAGVHQLGQVAVGEVAAAAAAGGVVLLGDVARGVVADAQEVAGPFDVALLLGGEGGQAGRSQALLDALPPCVQGKE